MTETRDQGLLAQILAEVIGLRAQVSALEVSNAEVISEAKHRASQVDDHEARLREFEKQLAEMRSRKVEEHAHFVTREELAEQARLASEAADARAAAADRKANIRVALVGIGSSIVVSMVVLAVNVWVAAKFP